MITPYLGARKVPNYRCGRAVPGNDLFNRALSSGIYVSSSSSQISNNYIHGANTAGIYLTSASNQNTLISNRVVSAVEAGIFVQGTNHLIVSNDISHTVQTHPGMINTADADGIRFFGSGSIFRKNYIHDITLADPGNTDPHIDAFQTWGPCSNILIEQNKILQMESPDQGITIEGLYTPVDGITIRNNLFMTKGTGYAPAILAGDTNTVSNVNIVNNTMVAMNGPSEFAIWIFKNLGFFADCAAKKWRCGQT
jgi:parallel beta-helix repeat protein